MAKKRVGYHFAKTQSSKTHFPYMCFTKDIRYPFVISSFGNFIHFHKMEVSLMQFISAKNFKLPVSRIAIFH